jgi:site-specific DNA-cytosine methylase
MKALSIFSGCGDLDIGVEAAGFENVASIELMSLVFRNNDAECNAYAWIC